MIFGCSFPGITKSFDRQLTPNEWRATLKFVKYFYTIPFLLTLIAILVVQPGIAPVAAAQATIAPSILIISPREGQALQGIEIIEGKIRGEGLNTGKISFRYAAEGLETWFFIADLEPDRNEGSQTSFKVEWDTTQITDGNYHLRVVADYEDSAKIFEQILNLRIRNHSAVETSTPAAESTQEVSAASLTPTTLSTAAPTATPLPKNPVEIETSELTRVLIISGGVILVAFLVGGIYSLAKSGFGRE